MTVEVIVPWRPGCPYRERALGWCQAQHLWPVTLAPGGEPWNKAFALMPAIERSCADIVVMADADVFTDGILQAVQAVDDGAPWAVPHLYVHRLTEAATTRLIAGERLADLPLEQEPYLGVEGGGIVVLGRETALQVPMDPRYVGWGQEDLSWAMALHTLCGPCWRGDLPLIHLWHPHPARMDRKRGSPESWTLFRRYCHARQSRQAMEALIGEAHVALKLAEHSLHPDPSLHL